MKAPGNLVVSAYVTCPDITLTVTPDLKLTSTGLLLHVDLAEGRRRLGGSALAQAYSPVRPRGRRPALARCVDCLLSEGRILVKRCQSTLGDQFPGNGLWQAGMVGMVTRERRD